MDERAGDTVASERAPRPTAHFGVMALLEVLRAPLLLSPCSDVLAGWALATAAGLRAPTASGQPSSSATSLAVGLACGVLLLAAGMAQNALADRRDDEQRKPERPLPRGAVRLQTVRLTFAACTLAALGLSALAPGLPWVVASIVVLTASYHYVLKPHRLAGCLALGGLRGLDMLIGVAAAAGGLAVYGNGLVQRMSFGDLSTISASGFPLIGCTLYGLYIASASLHASTDDAAPEHRSSLRPWSTLGLSLCALCLISFGVISARAMEPSHATLASLLFAYALLRLVRAWQRLPPPPLTGVALSTMYLIGAGLCLGTGQLVEGALVLALFWASKRLMRVFPPS